MELEELKRLTETFGFKEVKEEHFLNIIGKSYDECIISKLVLYSLNNPDILGELIKVKNIESIIDSGTELVINDESRIDIYFEGQFDNGQKFFIIIENKINSPVHDGQCKRYYDWAKSVYKNHSVYCFLLKPSYNLTNTDDEHFEIITYDLLYEIIDGIDDSYVNELRKEIKNCLMKTNYDELDRFFINNLQEISSKASFLWKEINNYFDSFTKNFNKDGKYNFDNTFAKENIYIRLYDKVEKWWSGYIGIDDQYYFYLELHVPMDLKKITINQIIKRYSNNPKTKLNTFMENVLYKELVFNQYFIVGLETFVPSSESNLFSNEWKHEFESWFTHNIKKADKNLRELAAQFHSSI